MNDVRELLAQAAFIQHLGIELVSQGEGVCETRMAVRPEHLQQDGFVHAGVQATLADHTAGAAAITLLGDDEGVLTIEFKVNLLRPAVGESLRCTSSVVRGGKTISVVESRVITEPGDKLVAIAMVTLAVAKRLSVRPK